MYENWKILKSDINNKLNEYSIVSKWCNNSNEYHIEDVGLYYKVEKNILPSDEEKQREVRTIRNQYLKDYVDPYQLVIRWNTLTQDEQNNITNYRQYLLDYTNQQNWWEENPKTFEEWSK